MRSLIRPVLASFLILSLLTGAVYPLAVAALARTFFPSTSGGSLIVRDGKVIGSELIGQPFRDPRYFWGRPSATDTHPYNAAFSKGSNLGPSNPALAEAVRTRALALRGSEGGSTLPVPADLVTASASGLDPHVSPRGAEFQVSRVAAARGLPEARVRELVHACTEGRSLGFLGEPRVNVLLLNLRLDSLE